MGQVEQTRIIAISLAVKGAPLAAMASATDTAFHLISVEKLPRNVKALSEKLADLKDKAAIVGAEMVIEDHTGMFSSLGRQIRLDDKGVGDRPVLVAAMERYLSLDGVGSITYPPELKSALSISRNLYNLKHGDGGKVSYLIDWEQLRDEQRVMLIGLHAGMCQQIYQKGFFERVFGRSDEGDCSVSDLLDGGKPSEKVNAGNGGRSFIL